VEIILGLHTDILGRKYFDTDFFCTDCVNIYKQNYDSNLAIFSISESKFFNSPIFFFMFFCHFDKCSFDDFKAESCLALLFHRVTYLFLYRQSVFRSPYDLDVVIHRL